MRDYHNFDPSRFDFCFVMGPARAIETTRPETRLLY